MKKIIPLISLIVLGVIVFSSPTHAGLLDLSGACGKDNAIQLSVYIPGITGVGKPDNFGNPCYYLTKVGSSAIGTLPDYIAGLYYFGVTIGGFVAAVMIMIGGMRWVMSGGSPDKISKAKEQMLNATVGLLLLLVSYTIFSIINPNLLRLQKPGAEKVGKVASQDLSSVSSMGKSATELTGWALAATQRYDSLNVAALQELNGLAQQRAMDAKRAIVAGSNTYANAKKLYGNNSPEATAAGKEYEKLYEASVKLSDSANKINQLYLCKADDHDKGTWTFGTGREFLQTGERSAAQCLSGATR